MNDNEQKRIKAYANRRSMMDLGMGLIYSAMGIFFVGKKWFGVNLDFPTEPFNYVFGGLCLLYGGFRIYRGIKKNYFN
jgi:uncharacterized membrane protein